MSTQSSPSAALLEAQERLQQLRAEARAARIAAGLPVGRAAQADGRDEKTAPASGGLTEDGQRRETEQTLHNGQQLLVRYRQRDGVAAPTGQAGDADSGEGETPSPWLPSPTVANGPVPPEQTNSHDEADDETAPPATVKHHPSLGTAVLERGLATVYRVWLACRHLDEDGRGWLDQATVREALTGEASSLRFFSWRRLRQILHKGHNTFWVWDQERDRIWLIGLARVAARLHVGRLSGQPVALPVAALAEGIGTFKAHLYAAWHSGRGPEANPVSREVQTEVTGVPARTQRHYCEAAGVERQTNISVAGRHSEADAQETAWERGAAAFTFIDSDGRQGAENGRYLAWQLPSSHVGPHETAARGRQRKVNRRLQDLVTEGARGNSREPGRDRRYYPHGRAAARAYNRRPHNDAYWQRTGGGGQRPHRAQIWYVLPGQGGGAEVKNL